MGAWPLESFSEGFVFRPRRRGLHPSSAPRECRRPGSIPAPHLHPQGLPPERTGELGKTLCAHCYLPAQCQALGLAEDSPGLERVPYPFQLGSPSLTSGGRWLWTRPQRVLVSVQGGPEESEDGPEDPGNGPSSNRESGLASRCSKDAEPVAISFLGALQIPVRNMWDGGTEKLPRFFCWISGEGVLRATWGPQNSFI